MRRLGRSHATDFLDSLKETRSPSETDYFAALRSRLLCELTFVVAFPEFFGGPMLVVVDADA